MRPLDPERVRVLVRRLAWVPVLTLFLAGVAWAATFSMGSEAQYSTGTGSGPGFVIAADLRGNGINDLIAPSSNNAQCAVCLGVGDGTFGTPTQLTTTTPSEGAAVGSLRGNGVLDIVVANQGGSTISVFLGDGSGGFGTKHDYTTTGTPYAVVLADFDGDGKLDVAVSSQGSSKVSVLLGDGTGAFGAKTDYTCSGSQLGVLQAGSLRGNGIADLVVANFASNKVSVLLGVGDGTFGAPTDYSTSSCNPDGLALADFNRDGRLDVAISGVATTGHIDVLLGDGMGAFGAFSTVLAISGGRFGNLVAGDMRGTGNIDLACSNEVNTSSNSAYITVGNGDGTFGSSSTLASSRTTPFGIVLADFDGDGRLDVAVSNANDNGISVWLQTTVDYRGETPNASSASGAYVRTISGERFVSGKVAR